MIRVRKRIREGFLDEVRAESKFERHVETTEQKKEGGEVIQNRNYNEARLGRKNAN